MNEDDEKRLVEAVLKMAEAIQNIQKSLHYINDDKLKKLNIEMQELTKQVMHMNWNIGRTSTIQYIDWLKTNNEGGRYNQIIEKEKNRLTKIDTNEKGAAP